MSRDRTLFDLTENLGHLKSEVTISYLLIHEVEHVFDDSREGTGRTVAREYGTEKIINEALQSAFHHQQSKRIG